MTEATRARPHRPRRALLTAAALVTALALTGCMPELEAGTGSRTEPQSDVAEAPTFISVIDGDTIKTSEGTVRLIGIDTPERGECGYDDAARLFEALLTAGDPITLELPRGQNDRDTYDRLLRYVLTEAGEDLGTLQIDAGNAVARFDSTDGYPAHPNEARYRAAQTATLDRAGDVVTVACAERVVAPSAEPAPQIAAPEPVDQSSELPWWMQYDSCAKLKRNQVGHPTGPFSRDNPDHAQLYEWFAHQTGNRGDGDGDGLACE